MADVLETKSDVTLTPEVKETPKTITLEQHEKEVRDARSAALAEVGRLRKESENAVKSVQAAQSRIDKLLKTQEDYELEVAQGNPEQLSAVQERQKRRRIESELETARQELNLKDEKLKQIESEKQMTDREQTVSRISAQYNVSIDRLSKLAKFTDGSQEAIEDIAKELPKKQEAPPLKPDSNITKGGTSSSYEKIRDDWMAHPNDPKISALYKQARRDRGL